MKIWTAVAVSIVGGFFLMVPLAMLFDAMNWPLFHTWGLAHGSFLIAWPVLTLASLGMILGLKLTQRSPGESPESK